MTSGENELEELLPFVQMLNALRGVKRVIRVNGEDAWENDAEHSYHLAMLGWFIVKKENLKLNIEKVLKYALAHDLVEVYAGDTYLYSEDKEHVASKATREEDARLRLEKEFPEQTEMHEAILAYMKKSDEESRFVYALDKLQPLLNIYLDDGRTWIEKNVTLKMIDEAKGEKIKLSPEVKKYYDLLMDLLLSRKSELFPHE